MSRQGPVNVVVHLLEPEGHRGTVAAAFESARAYLDGTPGLAAVRLLASAADRRRFMLIMEWDSGRAFGAWAREQRRAGYPSPLRPYQDRERPGGHYEVFAVAAR